MLERSLFEERKSRSTRYVDPPETELGIPENLIRKTDLKNFPGLSEPEVVRHFTNLSALNYGIILSSWFLLYEV